MPALAELTADGLTVAVNEAGDPDTLRLMVRGVDGELVARRILALRTRSGTPTGSLYRVLGITLDPDLEEDWELRRVRDGD